MKNGRAEGWNGGITGRVEEWNDGRIEENGYELRVASARLKRIGK